MRFLSLVLIAVLSSSAYAAAKNKGGTPPQRGKSAEKGGKVRRVVVAPMKQQNNLFGQQRRISASEEAEQMGLDRRFIGRLTAEVNAARRNMVRSRGSRFADIVAGRAKGEVVLYRDKDVTAFLDWSDPKHPNFNPDMESEEDLEGIPVSKRAHILVVPNQQREHVASRLGGGIQSSDLEATLKVVRAAEKIAKDRGIKNPHVYVSDSSNVMIGYLHVHIVGEKGPEYPPAVR